MLWFVYIETVFQKLQTNCFFNNLKFLITDAVLNIKNVMVLS